MRNQSIPVLLKLHQIDQVVVADHFEFGFRTLGDFHAKGAIGLNALESRHRDRFRHRLSRALDGMPHNEVASRRHRGGGQKYCG
jgi:hypothetical protein